MKKLIQFQLRFDEDLKKALEEEAKKNNISISQLIRDKCIFNPSKQNFQTLKKKLML